MSTTRCRARVVTARSPRSLAALAAPEVADPFIDAATLTRAVTDGLLDAPQLRNNPFGRGAIRTRIIDGAHVVVDAKGNVVSERKRLSK